MLIGHTKGRFMVDYSSQTHAPLSSAHTRRSSLVAERGFTIVELLIVIVVIAILAAITIVSYTGIQNRAKASALQDTTKQASTKVMAYAALNSDTYPATLSAASLSAPSGMTYQYYVNNAAVPRKFCVSANNGTSGYFVTSSDSNPKTGNCNDQNLVGTSINDWVQGDYSQTNGNPSSNPTTRIRQPYLIAVEPGATYAMNLNNSNYSFVIRTFDANQAFVSSVGGIASGGTYTIPTVVSYLGVGIYGSGSADFSTYTAMFADGTMMPSIVRQ